MIKLSVIGAKDFNDFELLNAELNKENIDVMVTGGKMGADALCREYAIDRDIPIQVFLPDYKKHGKSASYQRNLEMISNSNRVIIFWNYYSNSPFNYIPYIKEKQVGFRTVLY